MIRSIYSKLSMIYVRYKPVLIVSIMGVTALLFALFFINNPDAVEQLRALSIKTIVLLVLLYALMIAILGLVYDITLRLCEHTLSYGENFLLTSYSSIVNFFGPLQSGPGVRTAYLKKKHKVSIRTYVYATMLYYALFAAFSGMFFVIGFLPWWACVVIAIIGTAGASLILRIYKTKVGNPRLRFTGPLVVGFVGAVLLQLLVVMIIYGVELRALGNSLTLRQLMTYTGTANFALFVSLTPGALGFREAFLLFTKQLTGLDNSAIVTANLLDRVVYVLFLAILFVIIISFHGFQQFRQPKNPVTDRDP